MTATPYSDPPVQSAGSPVEVADRSGETRVSPRRWATELPEPSSQVPHPKLANLTDEHGNRTAVVLTCNDYEKLLEDLEDLATVAERSQEPVITHDVPCRPQEG
jgi:hypothetical protein